jgi:hypothetical protein
MKAKIIAILVMMLLIATALPAIGVTIKKGNENSLPLSNGSVDQKQTTSDGWGEGLHPPYVSAQSFKPAMENLTAVQLWFFKHANPPAGVRITVSIRDSLNGSDLTAKTINADDVGIQGHPGTWVFFNFEDITVIPEETYYIVCSGSKGDANGCYCWLFDLNDKYTRGEAWYSNDSGASWITLEEAYFPELPEPDFCFKTYFKQTRDKSTNKSFPWFLEKHPNLFLLIEKLLQQFEL